MSSVGLLHRRWRSDGTTVRPPSARASPDPGGWPRASRHRSCDYDRCSNFEGETDGEPAHHAARAWRHPVSVARGRVGLGRPLDRCAHLCRCLPHGREGERRGADALPLRPRRGRLRRPRRAGAGRRGRHDRLARDERLARRARDRRDRDEQGRHRRGRRHPLHDGPRRSQRRGDADDRVRSRSRATSAAGAG